MTESVSVWEEVAHNLNVIGDVENTTDSRLRALHSLRALLDVIEREIREQDYTHGHVDDTQSESLTTDNSFVLITKLPSLTKDYQWVIKAKVVEKSEITKWHMDRHKGQLFHVILQDSSGTIKCTVFGEMVKEFYPILFVGKVYCISQGNLRKNKNFEFEIGLNNNSVVVPIEKFNQISNTLRQEPQAQPLSQSQKSVQQLQQQLQQLQQQQQQPPQQEQKLRLVEKVSLKVSTHAEPASSLPSEAILAAILSLPEHTTHVDSQFNQPDSIPPTIASTSAPTLSTTSISSLETAPKFQLKKYFTADV